MKRYVPIFPILLAITACQDAPVPTAGPSDGTAPMLGVAPQQGPLADRYIVVFKPSVVDVDAAVDDAIRGFGTQVHYRYYSALKGFAATLPSAALNALRNNPNVDYIEADGIMTADAVDSWGLDRIDQRALPLSNSYSPGTTGSGVTVYIIDTGIRFTHVDFGGRASTGYDAVTSGGDASDCNGHGTHVAGTVGGATYGVAKAVALKAVRVLGCSGSGSTSGVIAGVDWVRNNHASPAVANMSLGGGYSNSLNNAVANSISAGVTFAVAAGNSNANACNYSPASTPSALTVGATTSTDARASYSNYGTCLDIFAPGSSIKSDYYTSNTATTTLSGTSMASPHVAGAAALYLQSHVNATPSQVAAALTGDATTGIVASAGTGSPNLLLFVGSSGGTLTPSADIKANGSDGPIYITSGQSVTLAWTSTDEAACTVTPGNFTGTSGSVSVSPPSSTTYSLDCDNGAATNDVVVNVSAPQTQTDVHVGDIDGSSNVSRKNWKATVTFTVHNAAHALAANATVSFTYSGGASGSSSCSAVNGTCTFTTGAIKNNQTSVTFTVTGISGTGLNYVPGSNHDPNPDSDGTTITVNK